MRIECICGHVNSQHATSCGMCGLNFEEYNRAESERIRRKREQEEQLIQAAEATEKKRN